MAPRSDHAMHKHLAWAQWWAFPWESAHDDWKGDDYPAIETLFRRGRSVPDDLTRFAASLPPPPGTTVLRLALASQEQLNLMLTLAHHTVNPQATGTLNNSHHLWCMRLSKALPAAILPPDSDPLQLLHRWVEPATWQRLRLRFARKRVGEVETASVALEVASSRLDTLWQAVVWRVTTMTSDNLSEGFSDVMP